MNTNTSISEMEIMQRIYEADYDAIKDLYEKYSPILYALVRKILKDEKQSEEVLADIFIIIQKRIKDFDFNTGNSYTWLITLAKNCAVYELKKKEGKVENIPQDEYILPRLSHLSESLELERALELKNNIRAAFNKLSETQKHIIYLACYEGLNLQEIAKKMKISQAAMESKVKTSLINLNENFIGKSSLFTVENEIVEMIYPFVLGCMDYDEQIKTFAKFKASESFHWKLLGEYQNLVALLPMIAEPEYPPEALYEKVSSQIYHLQKIKSFERVISASSITETHQEENIPDEIFVETRQIKIESELKRNPDEVEPVKPFKPAKEKRTPESSPQSKKKNVLLILVIVLIIFFIASAVLAYLFYKDRALYYETQIKNLTVRIENLTKEIQSKPEIPGLGELRNPQNVELTSVSETVGSGEIIFSNADKRGYMHIRNLPVLDSDNAYQLWGNFKGDFISLGVFKISARPDYYPFTLPESPDEGSIEFYVIESNAEGSRKPGSKIYLKGKVE